jgi:hypothetical protein
MNALAAYAFANGMDITVAVDGMTIVLTTDLPGALIHLAQVEHAVAVLQERQAPPTPTGRLP